jgi:hypothetical protein
MRRYLLNAGGLRGIRYDRHWDCYQVLMYTGSGAEWLFGDQCDEMMPGWGGNMWFADRTAAVIARDKARAAQRRAWQRLGIEWTLHLPGRMGWRGRCGRAALRALRQAVSAG